MEREWGGGEGWQEHATRSWIERLAANADAAEVAVLDGQTRPSFIEPHLARTGIRARIMLLDCTPEVRAARLCGPRAQPELATGRMDAWAVYLRGQADALGLRVLDTSGLSVEAVADALQDELDGVRHPSGA
jgi:hypothetical protein